MVIDFGRRYGLKIAPPVAARIAATCANDQAVVAQELQKLALYVDASPNAPKELDHDAVDAVGADSAEGDFLRLADLALGGAVAELADELARLPAAGSEAIPVVRSLQRRLLMLAPARARVERGEPVDAVMTSLGKSLFWKDKPLVGRMLSKWKCEVAKRFGASLPSAADVQASERELMFSDRAAGRSEAFVAKIHWPTAGRPAGAYALLTILSLSLDRFAGEALADHVELVEARVMERYGAALALVHDLDLEPEDVAELALERGEVGVDRHGVARAGAGDVVAGPGPAVFAAYALFRLAHRQALWR